MAFEAEEIDPGNWLPCLAWDGNEQTLPLGGQTRVPNFMPVKLVYRWEVADAESEEGFRTVKASELKATDDIIGAVLNENLITKIVQRYGDDFVKIKSSKTGKYYTRIDWRNEFKTDGLLLWALRDKRLGKKIFMIGEN